MLRTHEKVNRHYGQDMYYPRMILLNVSGRRYLLAENPVNFVEGAAAAVVRGVIK